MRNIFLFIRRFSTFLAFLVIQAVALWFLFTYNKFYRARGLGVANEVTGWFNTRYNTVEDFFKMGEENRRVHRMNDSLVNLLSSNFMKKDSLAKLVVDSLIYDTTEGYRRYLYRDAQVVYSTVNQEKNYIQINKGARDGIHDNMGVLSSDGYLVGTVINVSPNFSVVMSLLHVQKKTDVLIRKTSRWGSLSWDGKDPHFLRLVNIPRNDSTAIGDTIVTGQFSLSYPAGKVVGTVAEIIPDKATNFCTVRVKVAANFQDLQQVFVVENLQFEEQQKLLEETRKRVDENKSNTP